MRVDGLNEITHCHQFQLLIHYTLQFAESDFFTMWNKSESNGGRITIRFTNRRYHACMPHTHLPTHPQQERQKVDSYSFKGH